MCDAQSFQGVNIGAVGHRSRAVDVPASVAGQESDGLSVKCACQDGVGGGAPRAVDGGPLGAVEPEHVIKPGAADDAQICAHVYLM